MGLRERLSGILQYVTPAFRTMEFLLLMADVGKTLIQPHDRTF